VQNGRVDVRHQALLHLHTRAQGSRALWVSVAPRGFNSWICLVLECMLRSENIAIENTEESANGGLQKHTRTSSSAKQLVIL
jgi:hypothetical protein